MIEAALADLRSRNLVSRIWRGDHTVWKPDPTEISDRLGWLTITDRMRDRDLPVLRHLPQRSRTRGFGMWCCWAWAGAAWGRR